MLGKHSTHRAIAQSYFLFVIRAHQTFRDSALGAKMACKSHTLASYFVLVDSGLLFYVLRLVTSSSLDVVTLG